MRLHRPAPDPLVDRVPVHAEDLGSVPHGDGQTVPRYVDLDVLPLLRHERTLAPPFPNARYRITRGLRAPRRPLRLRPFASANARLPALAFWIWVLSREAA